MPTHGVIDKLKEIPQSYHAQEDQRRAGRRRVDKLVLKDYTEAPTQEDLRTHSIALGTRQVAVMNKGN